MIEEKRQYTCFVCGMALEKYHEYSKHIIDNHEEGREYVLCPLARCKAPVRDVRSHFKRFHPTEKLPQKGQMRALIWSDHRSPRKCKRKPKFKEGFFESVKNQKNLHFRSGYERDVYECLELMNEVINYKVENFHVNYFHNGKQRNYLPDLLLQFNDGHFEVWEIKPANQYGFAINKAKWNACREHCLARGWTFFVYSENEIRLLKALLRKRMIQEGKTKLD